MIKSSGRKELARILEDNRREAEWIEHIINNADQLAPIEDIVHLDGMWQWVWGSIENPRYELVLGYMGEAETEEAARSDLANIMRALKVVFGDLHIWKGEHSYIPHSRYKGTGMLGDREVEVELRVPWTPEGCKIERVQLEKVFYNVTCALEEA